MHVVQLTDDALPITLVALDDGGAVVGAVGLGSGVDAVSFYERCGWTVEERLVLDKGGWTKHVLVSRVS